ncbi:hypothetical protein V4_0325 [Lactococcus cremoris]|nr:hypothetical protein V4_0325 [Lactococcus cremoris]
MILVLFSHKSYISILKELLEKKKPEQKFQKIRGWIVRNLLRF